MTAPDAKPLRLRDQLIRSFAGVGALRALSMPISLVASIILARSLGPDAFGQYAFIMALVPLLALPAVRALPSILTREAAKCVHREDWATFLGLQRFGNRWVVVYSLLLLVVVFLVYTFIESLRRDPRWGLLPLVAFIVPLVGLQSAQSGITKGLGLIAQSEIPGQFVKPFAFVVVIAILAIVGPMTPAHAIGGQVIAAAIGLAAAAWVLARNRPAISLDVRPEYARREWNRSLLPLCLVAVIGTLNSHIGIILLGLIKSNEAVAAFQIADSGSRLVMLSLALVNMVIAPQIVKFRMDEDRANLQLLSRQSARAALALGLPVAIAFFFMGESIIRWLYGAEYSSAVYLPLVIMAAGHVLNVFFGSVGLLLVMSDHETDTLRSQAVAVTVNVVACALLIPTLGAVGAALGTVAGLVTWNVLLGIQVYRRLGIRPTAL